MSSKRSFQLISSGVATSLAIVEENGTSNIQNAPFQEFVRERFAPQGLYDVVGGQGERGSVDTIGQFIYIFN